MAPHRFQVQKGEAMLSPRLFESGWGPWLPMKRRLLGGRLSNQLGGRGLRDEKGCQ
jgi:hypothetical protein